MRKSLHVKLEPETHENLFALAGDHGLTVSSLVEAIVGNTNLDDRLIREAREIMIDRNEYQRKSS